MPNSISHQHFPLILLLTAFLFLPLLARAQEADTTEKNLNLEGQQQINLPKQFDRSYSGGTMNEMGTYSVPTETKYYYTPPFKGQYYLDLAVEAYRKKLEDEIGDNWYWQFLKAVSPYINNQFEFSVYKIYDMPIVDRDNPLFQSDQ